jgi:mRNA-degrading endonuclease RelE of RelBE toxin-antitoxin system
VTWLVQFTPRAQREIRRLDRQTADRVLRALTRLADTGQGAVVRLRNQAGERGLRVGDWRVHRSSPVEWIGLLFDVQFCPR